jgi:hypothetical protein
MELGVLYMDGGVGEYVYGIGIVGGKGVVAMFGKERLQTVDDIQNGGKKGSESVGMNDDTKKVNEESKVKNQLTTCTSEILERTDFFIQEGIAWTRRRCVEFH